MLNGLHQISWTTDNIPYQGRSWWLQSAIVAWESDTLSCYHDMGLLCSTVQPCRTNRLDWQVIQQMPSSTSTTAAWLERWVCANGYVPMNNSCTVAKCMYSGLIVVRLVLVQLSKEHCWGPVRYDLPPLSVYILQSQYTPIIRLKIWYQNYWIWMHYCSILPY